MKILLIVLAVLLFIILLISVVLARYLARPWTVTYKEAYDVELKKNFLKDYDTLYKEKLVIPSFDGYKLHGEYIPSNKESNKYVILTHGYTWNRLGAIKYMHIFRELGFNSIMYDLRGHGENKRVPVTMSLKESKDLKVIIDYVHKRFGEDTILGLHGESLGSATSIAVLKYKPKLDFVVADCGFSKLEHLLKEQIVKKFHLPAFLINTASIVNKLIYGYRIEDNRPIDSLIDNTIPICFIHGNADTLVPVEDSKEMFEVTKGYKELHITDGVDHALSYQSDPEKYKEIIVEFLNKVL